MNRIHEKGADSGWNWKFFLDGVLLAALEEGGRSPRLPSGPDSLVEHRPRALRQDDGKLLFLPLVCIGEDVLG